MKTKINDLIHPIINKKKYILVILACDFQKQFYKLKQWGPN